MFWDDHCLPVLYSGISYNHRPAAHLDLETIDASPYKKDGECS